MRCLVTGANGFLGGALARALLAQGHQVRSLQRSPGASQEAEGMQVHQGDLADAAAVQRAVDGCDVIFHVAAKAGVWGPRQSYFATNVLGTEHVIAATRAAGVRHLVYTSTPSVVFNGHPIRGADEGLAYGEKIPCAYAATKVEAERRVLAAHRPGELEVVALRPHLIWGPGDPHLVPRVLEKARAGRLRIVGRGDNRVDLTHVDNAVHGHLAAWEALRAGHGGGRPYFLSDGAPVALWPWINQLLQAQGLAPVTRRVPERLAFGLGAVLELAWTLARRPTDPPMTRFVAHQLAQDHWFSITAAREKLAYAPQLNHPQEFLSKSVTG